MGPKRLVGEGGSRERYARDGCLRVPNAVDADTVAAMRRRLRDGIATLAFSEVAGAMRPALGTDPAYWGFGQEAVFAALPGAFRGAVERVWGPGQWVQVEGELGGLAMPNLPCPGKPWAASAASWHVDEATPPGGVPGSVLLGFALLDRLEPGGGATVVLAGSPRRLALLADSLAEPVDTNVALAELAREEPWFAALLASEDRTPPEGCVSAGIPLELVELAGEAGDVWFMDPRCLHTTSANVSPRPRLLMRLTCLRAPQAAAGGGVG